MPLTYSTCDFLSGFSVLNKGITFSSSAIVSFRQDCRLLQVWTTYKEHWFIGCSVHHWQNWHTSDNPIGAVQHMLPLTYRMLMAAQ
eukprot:3693882-Amphidinium_carterae.1